MSKFIAIQTAHLRLDDLGGLTTETVNIVSPHIPVLGTVGEAKFHVLNNANIEFEAALRRQRASELTVQIEEKDRQRDMLFAEIKRTAKTGQQSSDPAMAAAGSKTVGFLHPFWEIGTEPLMSQTNQIQLIQTRYYADPSLSTAATTLGIYNQIHLLFAVNSELLALYNERLNEMTEVLEGPSASSLKNGVAKAYNGFCTAVEITLSATPSQELEQLFAWMNDIRRKYVSRLPLKLDEKHTTVAPIESQKKTGKHVTPLPRVFYGADGEEVRELVFAQDFSVTYRNNVNAGEAKIIIHGKGKYTGQHETSFYIVND